MAGKWDSLILNDYEAVMPLTWNKKWGIRYLYQPPFAPQLGIFSPRPVSADLVNEFIRETKRHFRFAEVFFNHFNDGGDFSSIHCNLVVPLHEGFDIIKSRFKSDLVKNLTRAKKFNLRYGSSTDYQTAIRLYSESYGKAMPHLRASHYQRFSEICRLAGEQQRLVIRQVAGPNDELLAINLFLIDDRRLYNLMSTTLPNGRTMEANHVLMYEVIREFAGQPLVLDMEGSDLAGIARFYRKFGAVDEPYYFLRFNNLPGLVRWLKA
jgi:hypothetical protein